MIPVIGQLVGRTLGAIQAMGYPGIAAIVGLESMGVPMPGETTLIAASYLAATGDLSLPLVIGSAILGSVVGDSIGYAVGRKGRRRFLDRYGRYVRISPETLARADRYFVRHGAKTVLLGRFFPLLRILAGPLAGTAKMPYHRFLAANFFGAFIWATTMGIFAFFFGKPVAAFLSSLGVWGLVAIAAFLLARFAFKRWLQTVEKRRAARKCSDRRSRSPRNP
jgi:membrane protein DedA with SNARE-associated domain